MMGHQGYSLNDSLVEFRQDNLQEFSELILCEQCSFATHSHEHMTSHMTSYHEETEKRSREVSRVSPPPDDQCPSWWRYVSEEKMEEVRAARTELKRVHKELEELNLAFDRIVLAPDVYGVSHAVALRGDVWTHKAEAHAHIFVEMWLAPGDYRLHSGVNPAVAMTVQWHPSSPMVDPAAREVLQGAGKGYPLKGMLHTARGEPVVWFEVWFLGELSECEWRIAVNADVCVGKLTVKKNWVWE